MPKETYRQAAFLTSAAKPSQLPKDEGAEVAFAGCSNAGKSSTLNALTDNKGLARTSKTPGRTQLLNVFSLDDERRLVDLPGYGYAKVTTKVKEAWQKSIDMYLRERKCLRGIVLVADSRHPMKPFECDMLAWASTSGMPVLYVLNKMDKLSKNEANKTLFAVRDACEEYEGDISIMLFSAAKKQGLENMCEVLDEWLGV